MKPKKPTNSFKGTLQRDGTVTLRWNCQCDKLYSPDGLKHCLPCERCGQPQWADLPYVSILCESCARAISEDLGDYGPAVASGEISEVEAITAILGPRPW